MLPYADLCYLAEGHDAFLAALEDALAEPADDPRRALRRRIAAENDWRERYRTIDAAVVETFPLVSVIVVTFGGLPLTRRCLESLLEGETWPHLEVLVVDNSSADGTPEHLRSLASANLPGPRLPPGSQPRLPGGQQRRPRRGAREIVLLLNNDTVCRRG